MSISGSDKNGGQRLPLTENQGRNDAFYTPRGGSKKRSRKVLESRPKNLSAVLAKTLEGMRSGESQVAVSNYRSSNRSPAQPRQEWKRKRLRSLG